jgi:hypothetical protein
MAAAEGMATCSDTAANSATEDGRGSQLASSSADLGRGMKGRTTAMEDNRACQVASSSAEGGTGIKRTAAAAGETRGCQLAESPAEDGGGTKKRKRKKKAGGASAGGAEKTVGIVEDHVSLEESGSDAAEGSGESGSDNDEVGAAHFPDGSLSGLKRLMVDCGYNRQGEDVLPPPFGVDVVSVRVYANVYKKLLNAKPSPDGSPDHVHWTAAAASRK